MRIVASLYFNAQIINFAMEVTIVLRPSLWPQKLPHDHTEYCGHLVNTLFWCHYMQDIHWSRRKCIWIVSVFWFLWISVLVGIYQRYPHPKLSKGIPVNTHPNQVYIISPFKRVLQLFIDRKCRRRERGGGGGGGGGGRRDRDRQRKDNVNVGSVHWSHSSSCAEREGSLIRVHF